ncbi:hypothetical protein SFR_1033 [Streptomyces sp. FR-008]|nr:hypothetical protein SFR_1033 [Streptomyces sp. FR-008]
MSRPDLHGSTLPSEARDKPGTVGPLRAESSRKWSQYLGLRPVHPGDHGGPGPRGPLGFRQRP